MFEFHNHFAFKYHLGQLIELLETVPTDHDFDVKRSPIGHPSKLKQSTVSHLLCYAITSAIIFKIPLSSILCGVG